MDSHFLRLYSIHQSLGISSVLFFNKKLLKQAKYSLFTLCFCLSLISHVIRPTQAAELPLLGDSTSGILSPEDEYKIGQVWLRSLRAQADIVNDPMIDDYLEHLAYTLASHSPLQKPQLEVILLNKKEINAFAVPGGVIGVNAGLFLYAESEDELSAVLAHELAHLSQRHFVRNLETARHEQWISVGALLASIAIAATQGADPGLAAIASTQALAVQSQLEYSRQNEEEADRIGMQTLAATGMYPYAMPRFFARMKDSTNLPDFLLTHPVTAERIADATNRAAQLPAAKITTDDTEFQLIRAQALVTFNDSDVDNIKRFQEALSGNTQKNSSYRYGLVRAYLKANHLQEALDNLKPLRQENPSRITYSVTEAEILIAQHSYTEATTLLQKQLALNPNNYPLTFYYVQSLLKEKQSTQAIPLLEAQLAERPNNIVLWKLLAEANGANSKPIGVHRSRAEILFLTNQTERALDQLKYALALTGKNYQLAAKISARIEEMKQAKKELDS